ncbi:cell wall protein [Microbacterium sp. Sa4CUA7]|uniref:Cell wall protein n=1 Tax=Microbacterium pullorum TaxID=2762236 RepID=A0ABR8S543_9MICO|nr:cell wall protein [Microbacterium pullorum]MBD7958598.1 cell wall protein [Microbacterium pullorum]
MRASCAAIALATLVVLGMPSAATAATGETASPPRAVAASAATPAPDQGDDGYTPDQPEEPTLAGSFAVGECERDVPWIDYAVELTDPDAQVATGTVTLTLSDGTNSTTLTLGELVDNRLSGRVLWPGAAVDAEGNAAGWPGWAYRDGTWVPTDGNFAWTRGAISAVLEVNPQLAVPLAYPPGTPECVTGPRFATAGLAVTGGTVAALLPLAIGGSVIVLGGAGLLLLRRRRS